MRTLAIALLTIFSVSGCNSVERGAICRELKNTAYTLKPLYDVSIKYKQCRARCYNWDAQESVSLSECKSLEKDMLKYSFVIDEKNGDEVMILPLERCEDIAGFHLRDIAGDIKPKTLRRAALMEDKCR